MFKQKGAITTMVIVLIILVLLFPFNALALNQEEAAWKSEEMARKYAAGDQEGAYQIFLELENMGILGFGDFFIPKTNAQIQSFKASLRSQNISKSDEEIKKYSLEMERLNKKMFQRYMQQDGPGAIAAAQEMNALSKKFLQTTSAPLSPSDNSSSPTVPGSLPSAEGPVLKPADPVNEEQIEKWEKMLEDALKETNYLKTTQNILNYTKTGIKISGKLAKVPLLGMVFDGVNIPFDSLENYQMGDNVFKAFAKSLSFNTFHALTNLFVGTPVTIRKWVDEITGIPLKDRHIIQDYRYTIKSGFNEIWDSGYGGVLGEGVGKEELERRRALGYYGNAYMNP